MEEVLARIFQFSVALIGAFLVALWFALVIWTYRDAVQRSRNPVMQVFSTLIVVLFFIPGVAIYLLLRPRETIDERQQRWIEEEYLAQELDEIAACPSCNHTIRDEWIYCPTCRYQLRRACQSCGHLVETTWDVCAFCGIDLRLGSSRHEATEAQPEELEAYGSAGRSGALVPASIEGPDVPLKTADGGAVLLEEADTVHPNGSGHHPDEDSFGETGELPTEETNEALESGVRSAER